MARLFVRLKLRLIANGFRRGWQHVLGTVVATLYALPVAVVVAVGVAVLGRRADLDTVAGPVVVLGFCLVWLLWIVGPIVAFGMDETLDPGRLRLLPLGRRQLMTGLLAASAVGIGPLATLLALSGVVGGFAPAGPGALVVVAAVVGLFVLCITSARAVTTALSRRLSSRRGRDVLTFAAAVIGLAFAGIGQLPNLLLRQADGDDGAERMLALLDTLAGPASVLPPAWPARAVTAAAAGDLLAGLAWLAATAAAVAAFAWWWTIALERSAETGAGEATSQTLGADLYPPLVRWLPRNRLGAGVAKDLRYAWRVPQLRVQHLISVALLVPLLVVAGVTGVSEPALVLASPVIVVYLAMASLNQFGADRGAVWMLDTTGPRWRTDLVAKSATGLVLALPSVVVAAVVLAALTGGWLYVPVALVVAVGVHAVTSAVGVVVSVYAPFPLPDSGSNVFLANAGAGCSAVVLQFVALTVEGLLLAPIGIGLFVAFTVAPPLVAAVAAGSLALGGVVWSVGLGIATKRLDRAGPEFVTALSPKAG